MWQSEQYARSKTISSVVYARWTKIPPYIYGASCWTKRNSPLTCYARPGSIQKYRPTSSSMVSMISMQHLWHLREPNASPMTNPANVECRLHMDSMDGTWGQHPNTIDVIKSTFKEHMGHEFVIQWNSFQPTAKCPTCHHMMHLYMQ